MSHFNGNDLCAQVTSDFNSLSRGISDATRMNEIFNRIMDTTVRAVRDAVNTSNQHALVAQLPPEILGNCFALLPLQDAIRASHVSRSWRKVALNTPRMWSSICMECDTQTKYDLLTMALSRSSHAPADLKMSSILPSPESAFETIVLPRLHRIRTLNWYSQLNMQALRRPAPLLESLISQRTPLEMPNDFLGGRVGRLRVIRCPSAELPAFCPALSTLVELHVENMDTAQHAASFAQLFVLCPRLESLTLSGLQAAFSHFLPRGPAPPTLRALSLETKHSYDLTQHYLAWNTPNLRRVSLNMAEAIHAPTLPDPLIGGAHILSIREDTILFSGTWIIAELPDGSEHAVAVPEASIARAAELILDARPRLSGVHTLHITIDVLEHFTAAVLPVFPGVKHIAVHLESMAHACVETPRVPRAEYKGWDALVHLEAVLDLAPRLESLVVYVWCSWGAVGCPPNGYDAGFIFEHFEFLAHEARSHALVPDIRVRGFEAAALRNLDIDCLPVHFDSVESFGDPEYWPYKTKLRDCD